MPTIYHRAGCKMVGTLPPSLVELRRTSRFAHPTAVYLILRSALLRASRRMNGTDRASWFETALRASSP